MLGRQYKSIEELIIKTHFDKEKPENQNIYISNLKSKYIMVHNGDDWIVKNRNDIVDDLYDDKAYIIFCKVDDIKDDLPFRIVYKFDKIRTDFDEKKIRDALLKDINLLLYNKRKIPIMSHKIK